MLLEPEARAMPTAPHDPIRPRRRARAAALAAAALLAAACASPPKPAPPAPPPPPPTAVQAIVVADSGLNPDHAGRASPIVLRVLELKSLAAFERNDFFSLFDKEREALGAELLAREEIALRPGGQAALAREVQPETRYLGVVAGYRDLERSAWRASVALPRNRLTVVLIRLGRDAVTAEAP